MTGSDGSGTLASCHRGVKGDVTMSARAVMVLCAVWLVGCATETPPPRPLSTTAPPPQGWVLWEASRKGPHETWSIMDAYALHHDCVSSRIIAVDAAASTAAVVRRAGHMVVLKQPDGEEWLRYLCLPATIDPRK